MKNLLISNIKRNVSLYIYGLLLTTIISYFYVSIWLDSFEKPVGIVVDLNGSIIKTKDQAKEKRQGSKFWEHQLELINIEIEKNSPELLIKHQEERKIFKERLGEITNDLRKESSKTMEAFNNQYPHYAKIREIERQKEELGYKYDEAIQQEAWKFMYEFSLRHRDELIHTKEIVVLKLNKAREAEILIGQKKIR